MNRCLSYIFVALVALVQFSAFAYGGPLDDYYLRQFGEIHNEPAQKALASEVLISQESAHCGTPLKRELSRDWSKLETTTQKVLAKQLESPTLSASVTSSGNHFIIHYDTSGTNAPNITSINQYTNLGLTSISDWANKVADAFETAYTFYANQGYHPPPNVPYDVYLVSLASASEYGVTQDIRSIPSSGYPNASSSFIEIDKDFTNRIFNPGTYSPLQSLQVTSAHEFHHAIQYGYNYYFDIWYAEVTATWLEDEVYDSVNQSYSYIQPWFSQSNLSLDIAPSTSTGGGYGRWVFNRYLAEKHTTSVIRSFWEKLAGLSPANSVTNSSGDIKMTPIINSVLSTSYNSTLAADFFGFTKRVYTRDWTSHTGEITQMPTYSPITNYTVSSPAIVSPTVTLPHYAFAYYKFTPSTATTSLNLYLNKTSGIQTAVFQKDSNGTITEITPNSDGVSYTINGFNTSSEVALLITNTTDVDNHQASFSTNNGNLPVTDPAFPPVNGVCGSSNGGTFTSAPNTNLCNAGTASAVTSSNSYSWTCSGTNGGTSANCSANSTLRIVTPTTGSGYTISPSTAISVNIYGIASFTVTPDPGYGVVVSGCGGSLNGTTYTTGAITANCTVAVTAVARNASSGPSGPAISDALKVLQFVAGLATLTPIEMIRYDVAPLDATYKPSGNGTVDTSDVIMILRKSIGLETW